MKVFFLFLLVLTTSSAFGSLHECGSGLKENVTYKWCIDKSSDSSDVLYYLHGGSGSEQSWSQAEDNLLIQKEWSKARLSAPTVITISFGQEWILSEIAHSTQGALYPIFVNQIMPELEQKINFSKGNRFLKGESMGGFNATQLLFKNPKLFARAALLCPGISTVGPYSSDLEVNSLIERNKTFINKEYVQNLIKWAKWEFPTLDSWNQHDPLQLVKKISSSYPEIYISCGNSDEYGFFEGSEKFVKLAQERSAKIQWHTLKGGHCVYDVKSVADFFFPQH